MDIWVGYLIWNCLALKSQQKPYSWKIHNGLSYSGNRGYIFERYSCDLADSVSYVYVYTPSLNPILIEQNIKQIFSYNRTKHRYEFLTIGQKTDKIFLRSDKTPIWFPYKWFCFSYTPTNTSTIFLQSDKSPILFSYNRTKHRYDFLTTGKNTRMIFSQSDKTPIWFS